ncbi:unnamed protein product [Ectocarpus sp. CCAP 1310/34]|nr:unnamed protein product [Ectocarpus sp. CCAP 1310/34]
MGNHFFFLISSMSSHAPPKRGAVVWPWKNSAGTLHGGATAKPFVLQLVAIREGPQDNSPGRHGKHRALPLATSPLRCCKKNK